MTTPAEVRERLEGAGHTVTVEDQGTSIRIYASGFDATINVWSTGTCNVQGRDQAAVQEVLGDLVGRSRRRGRSAGSGPAGHPSASSAVPAKKVFVVYGHDTNARTQLDAMLRRWGLEPLILDQLPSGGNTIIEKLEHYQRGVEWAVVILTPDDLGYPALDPPKAAPRPRQNVVLEMGMLLGKLDRQHVAMVYKESDPTMELPSDIQGYIYIPFADSVEEAGRTLAKEMAAASFCNVPADKI